MNHWDFFRAQSGAILEKAGSRRMAALEEARALGERIRAERPAHDVDSMELLRELREGRTDSTD